MAVAVNQLVARVGAVLNDSGNVRWTAAEVVDWFNEGAVLIVQKLPDACTKTVSLQLAPGSKQSNPADCIEILDMRQNSAGAAITPCDRPSLDRFMPGWMNGPLSSSVVHWMDDPQPDVFYVYPAQGASAASVVLTYSAVPAAMLAGSNITIRDIYADKLVNYALYRAFSKDAEAGGDPNRAVAYFKLVFE